MQIKTVATDGLMCLPIGRYEDLHHCRVNERILAPYDSCRMVDLTTISSIHYYVAICQLFAPLLEDVKLSDVARDRIQNITIQSAKDGLDLYEKYRSLYSNRQQPHFLAFCLVHLADVMVRHGEKDFGNGIINFCLETLAEAAPGFAFVETLQVMFCERVLGCGLALPPPAVLSEVMGMRSWNSFSREDKLDCCERLTYAQPVDLLTERLDPNLASDFEEEWRAFNEA